MSAGVVVYSPYIMQSLRKRKIAVLGAGTVGLSAALKLAETYRQQVEVTIIAAEFLQQTTSYGSGGLWEPYQIAGMLSSNHSLISLLCSMWFLMYWWCFDRNLG